MPFTWPDMRESHEKRRPAAVLHSRPPHRSLLPATDNYGQYGVPSFSLEVVSAASSATWQPGIDAPISPTILDVADRLRHIGINTQKNIHKQYLDEGEALLHAQPFHILRRSFGTRQQLGRGPLR